MMCQGAPKWRLGRIKISGKSPVRGYEGLQTNCPITHNSTTHHPTTGHQQAKGWMEKLRIDKWLWAARFFKTRSLAVEEIDKGRVRINDVEVKPAREVKAGEIVSLRQGPQTRTVVVRGISNQRGAAPVAQKLYEETAESLALKAAGAERHRLQPEPAQSQEHGRPTKRDRRSIDKAKGTGWDSRWSASAD